MKQRKSMRTYQFKYLDKATVIGEAPPLPSPNLVKLLNVWGDLHRWAHSPQSEVAHNGHMYCRRFSHTPGLLPSGITMLQRSGIGMFFAILTMVVAAFVEARRVEVALKHGLLDQSHVTMPMSGWRFFSSSSSEMQEAMARTTTSQRSSVDILLLRWCSFYGEEIFLSKSMHLLFFFLCLLESSLDFKWMIDECMDRSIKVPLLNVTGEPAENSLQQKNNTWKQGSTRKGGWSSSIYIIGVQIAETFALCGIAGNLITYLTKVLHEPTATAAKNINIWFGVATLLPLLGAYVADSYLGHFNMILFASMIYMLGVAMLTTSVAFVPLKFRHVCFFLSLYTIAIGVGGYKPCIQTFGADQFHENKPVEKKAKSSFFNWSHFGICFGASAAMLVVYYVQENVSWAVGFGVPAIAMAFAVFLFLLGKQKYRQQTSSGSPLARVFQVFVAACVKSHLSISRNGYTVCCDEEGARSVESRARTLALTEQFKYLDKAAIIDEIDSQSGTRNNWRLCSVTQVEEAKLVVRLVPIWLSCLIYAVIFAHPGTFFTKQGSTMNTKLGNNFHIPAASLQVATSLVIILTVPIYDRILVPAARKVTGLASGITMLQRIGIGMFCSILAMVVAALVEARRVKIASDFGILDQPDTSVPMSICWLLPQYVLVGVSDVFTVIGLQELFYDQMPDGMRSIGSAAYLSISGFGSLLSSIVISVVQDVTSRAGNEWLGDNLNHAHLDYYYWLLAGLSSLGLCVYVGVSMRFMYKKVNGDDEPCR